ncbi:MAG: MBL fold metallo-hydrolase [Solirubrobacteraceae bacterium]
MRVTVLGKSPAWQDAAGACSGYLVQEDGFTVLLDCGNGVFSKLRPICDYVDVDAVVITHMHADHFLDLVPFSYALRFAPRQQPVPVGGWPGTDHPARPALYLPPRGTGIVRRVSECWGDADLVPAAFTVAEFAAAQPLRLGPLTLRFCEVPHYVLTHAVQVAGSGSRFTFGADCGPNDALVGFARDTDLLMVEATLTRPEHDRVRGHLTAREAGEHGQAAGARRLVVTHYSDELDPELTRTEAAAGYGGGVELAGEGVVYTV